MPVGQETLDKIVAATVEAVGEYLNAEKDIAVGHLQIIGAEIVGEVRKEMERQRKEQDDPKPVPSGTINHRLFWQHLLGLLASVGMKFDDLHAWVIRRASKGK